MATKGDKVYCLFSTDSWSNVSHLLGVFATREDAEAARIVKARDMAEAGLRYFAYTIDEEEVR